MKFLRLLPLFLLALNALAEPAPPIDAEVCVYGGTPSGVMAAVAAARLGHTVSLVDINAHTGGVVSGGLVATDMGDRKTVGGLADEFFLRIVRSTATSSATTRAGRLLPETSQPSGIFTYPVFDDRGR